MSEFNVNGVELEVGVEFLIKGRSNRKYVVVRKDEEILDYMVYSSFGWEEGLPLKCTEFPDTFQTLKPHIYFKQK